MEISKPKLTARIKGLGDVYYINQVEYGFPGGSHHPTRINFPFHEAVPRLLKIGAEVISAKDLAYTRLQRPDSCFLLKNGSYVKEGFLWRPRAKDRNILLKKSLLLKDIEDGIRKFDYNSNHDCYHIRKNFSVSAYLETLVEGKDYIFLKENSIVPAERYGEDYRTVFLFEEHAKDYGLLCKEYKYDVNDKRYPDKNFHKVETAFRQPISRHDKNLSSPLWLEPIHYDNIIKIDHYIKHDRVTGLVREHPIINRKYSAEHITRTLELLGLGDIKDTYMKELDKSYQK